MSAHPKHSTAWAVARVIDQLAPAQSGWTPEMQEAITICAARRAQLEAAPELLSALRKIAAAPAYVVGVDDAFRLDGYRELARAAIATAEGTP